MVAKDYPFYLTVKRANCSLEVPPASSPAKDAEGHIHDTWNFPGYRLNRSCGCWPIPQQHRIRAVSATYTTAHRNTGSLIY